MVNPISVPAPKGLGVSGMRLWRAITTDFDLGEHELSLLRQAACTADLCDSLQRLVDAGGLLVGGRVNPALVELRAQRILLARLVVWIRVPLADDDAQDTTLTVLAGNCYRLLARKLPRYELATPDRLWRHFLDTTGTITVAEDHVRVDLALRTYTPVLIDAGFPELDKSPAAGPGVPGQAWTRDGGRRS